MHKIYITTFQNADNYGAMLQCYALSSFLGKKNDVEVINYDNRIISDEYRVIRKLSRNPLKAFTRLLVDLINIGDAKTRKKSFELFRKDLPLSKKINSLDELGLNDNDVLIAGSDQIWNPIITHGLDDVYFLNTNCGRCRKIAYAASCGAVSSLKGQEAAFKRRLKHFSAISVRENSLAEYIAESCGDKPFVSIDPTFLIEKDEWLKIINTEPQVENKYMFVYTAGKTDGKLFDIATALAQETGYKIVFFDKKRFRQQKSYNGFRWYKAGPKEFLGLLFHSEIIITASFHGLAMATILNKEMVIVPEEYPDRLLTLARSAGLESRIANSPKEAMQISKKAIDWDDINKTVKKIREKSSRWLLEAIGNNSHNEQK